MNTQAKVLVGFLSALVITLAMTLGVALTRGDDDNPSVAHSPDGDQFAGMLEAIASMDSAAMLGHMKEILGDEGYQRMVSHMDKHQSGSKSNDADVDRMMHKVMDGMMGHMPAEPGQVLPPASDEHHRTPAPP